jgi:hypothetical protein
MSSSGTALRWRCVYQVTAEEANFLSASRAWMAEVLAKYNAPKVKDIDGASAADRARGAGHPSRFPRAPTS